MPTLAEKLEKQCHKIGIHPSAIQDVLTRADVEGLGAKLPEMKPGKQIRDWLKQQKTTRPHWFAAPALESPPTKDFIPEKKNSKSSKENNPWSTEHWNPKAQYEKTRAIGAQAAAGIAESAGSFLGAPRPGAKRLTSRYQKV